MTHPAPWSYGGAEGVLASMHAKERVIAPILADGLNLTISVTADLDTDRFGTFTGEIARQGSQLDAARAKALAGLHHAPHARVGLASEGSFGPHPYFPFLATGRELVLLVDRDGGFELTGADMTTDTNFAHRIVHDGAGAAAFAKAMGFPTHGLIVMGCRDERPAADILLVKDVTEADELNAAVQRALRLCDGAFLQTDMRAHRNPTRMAAIGRATRDLVRRFHSRCPACVTPGFDTTERRGGLPCAWCGAPTRIVMAEILSCLACGHRQERVTDAASADPAHCDACNP